MMSGGSVMWRDASSAGQLGFFPGASKVGRTLACVVAVCVCVPALAADLAVPNWDPRSATSFQWSGFYVGGHAGYTRGRADITVSDIAPGSFSHGYGSLYGGIQGGYNVLVTPRFLFGIEGDITFPNYLTPDPVVWGGATSQRDLVENIDWFSSLRLRAGYVLGNWLPYATAGFAFSNSTVTHTLSATGDETERARRRTGWVAGFGLEYGFERAWSARAEYLYTRLGSMEAGFGPATSYSASIDAHALRLGLNRKLDDPDPKLGETNTATLVRSNGFPAWEFHAQTTFIYQGYPSFPALYSGPNSLTPGAQAKQTWSNSAFIGVRLWDGGELHYNPELLQGFGLSSTVGAGGFPNGEAQKSDFLYPRYNTSRLFLRHTFGFGGETEKQESEQYELGGKRDISRLTVQAGKFSIKDQFDTNEFSSDPRQHFLNWSLWSAGAFDYAADKLGLTYGVSADLNQKHWAVRGGYFLIGDVPNSNNFDPRVFERGGYLAEGELRYSLFSQPGKLRLTGWANNAFSGSYREALALVAANPGLDPTDAITLTRKGRVKYGYGVNVEQQIADGIGVFGRWSWNNGQTEIMAFTDIDASLAGGVSIKGKGWGRPEDTLGIGMAVNALSGAHRDYIAAGGLSVLIGDGRLNYTEENVFEAFYSIGFRKGVNLTLDYQHLRNPAYNADRGPVHIFAARMHAEM